jgi:sugar/nucleoside kinase (ribokinase family)
MREDIGGGAFNALANATYHGVAGSLLSVRGGDDAGARVASAVAARGICDLSSTYLDRATPSYTALVTCGGEVVAALADMELYERAFAREVRRSRLRAEAALCDAMLIDANLPEAAAAKAARLASGIPLFALAISPAKAVRLAGLLQRIDVLFLNRREADALCGGRDVRSEAHLAGALKALGLRGAVVTEGSGPLIAFDATGTYRLLPARVAEMADATGAGDALAGTAIASLMSGAHFPEAIRRGIAAAAMNVASPSAVAPFDARLYRETLAAVAAAEPLDGTV